MPTRGGQVIVPGHLAIEVSMDIDESRGDHKPIGVDHATSGSVDPTHLSDHPFGKCHVGRAASGAGTVDDGAPAYHDVMHVTPPKMKSSWSICRVVSVYQPDVCGSWVTMSPVALWK